MRDPFTYNPNIRLDAYYKEIEVFEQEFYTTLRRLMGKRATNEELQRFLVQYDFYQLLVQQGYEGKASEFVRDFDQGIAGLMKLAGDRGQELFGKVNLEALDELKLLNLKGLLRRGQDFSEDVRRELLQQTFSGYSALQIRDNVLPKIQEQMKFHPSWFASMLNTSYSEYNSIALKHTTSALNQDVRYILRGPVDKVTRPQCKHALMMFDKEYSIAGKTYEGRPGGFTMEEIEAGALGSYKVKGGTQIYDFEKRGGFNCRHYWEVVTDSIDLDFEG